MSLSRPPSNAHDSKRKIEEETTRETEEFEEIPVDREPEMENTIEKGLINDAEREAGAAASNIAATVIRLQQNRANKEEYHPPPQEKNTTEIPTPTAENLRKFSLNTITSSILALVVVSLLTIQGIFSNILGGGLIAGLIILILISAISYKNNMHDPE